MAVREQGRARVIYSLPEPRRPGVGGGLGMVAMLMLALLLFAGGLLIGRWTGPAAEAPAAPQAPAERAPEQAAPAAPAVPLPRAVTGTGDQVWSGRWSKGNLVRVGWAHSREGAVGAATEYVAALSSPLVLDPARRRAAVEAIAAPAARAGLQREADGMASGVTNGLGAGDVLLKVLPVGYKVDSYDASAATVRIWMTGFAGAKDRLPVEKWGVSVVRLQWSAKDKDWKEISAAVVAGGPIPVADTSSPTQAREFFDQAKEFEEYRYAPGS